MPNGHGGQVRFLPVALLLVCAAVLIVYARKSGEEWAVYGGYGLAALIGERFAHHLHRWKSEEYDGSYYSDAEKAAARKTYIVAAIIYVIGALVAWNLLITK
jgi:hypothetical protein